MVFTYANSQYSNISQLATRSKAFFSLAHTFSSTSNLTSHIKVLDTAIFFRIGIQNTKGLIEIKRCHMTTEMNDPMKTL